MIERIEVIRGGGSALFGSNAIAGTINVITKNPTKNEAQASIVSNLIVEKQGKQKKVVTYKYKPKKGSHRKQGHRQPYTKVVINAINA